MDHPILTIVVPCYNEEDVLEDSILQLDQLLMNLEEEGLISDQSKILFVDDGSKDDTWRMIYKETLKGAFLLEGFSGT